MNASRLFSRAAAVAALLTLAAGCSDPQGGGTPGGGPGAPGQQSAQGQSTPAPAQDEPASPPVTATLIETLLERRTDDAPIYVADCTRKPESENLTKLKTELEAKGLKYSQSEWPNYQYYLNKVIPMTRREGRVWIIYDHHLEELTRTLQKGYLELHSVDFSHEFPEATLALVTNDFAGNDAQRYVLTPVSPLGSTTTNIVFTPDDAVMFVTSKEGQIRWFSRTSDKSGEVMRMPRTKTGEAGLFHGGESGMIGMALHPKFADNRKLYLHYNWRDEQGNRRAVLSEWTADMSGMPGKITFGGERELLTIEQVHDNHNAGCLAFGPDGYLYIGVGDGEDGKWTIGRSPAGSLRGKILRIDVDHRDEGKQYAVPADNPFVGNADFPPETWAWGFRNPWRIVFVPDGRLIASDIGEDVNEELTFVVKGKHHGWPYYEGLHERNPWTLGDTPLQPPLVPYGRQYGMSVIAGNVYEGKALPELVGKFVFCDYMSGTVWAFPLPDTDTTLKIEDCEELTRWPLLLPSITKGPDGELYFAAHTGEVLELKRGDANSAVTAPRAAKADPAMARSMFGNDFTGPAAPTSTPAQLALGKALFADPRLSADGKQSCATCHPLDRFGQDGRQVAAVGGPARNTGSVLNASRQFAQFRDFRVATVEQAVVDSLASHMGNASADAAAARVADDAAFAAAFPGDGAATGANVGLAIGAYLRTLVTTSRWERFLDGDDKALTDDELVGLGEFVNSGCTACHMYRGLGGGMPQKLGLVQPWTGPDRGRGLIDATPGQEYFFKVPTLFNVAETGPWYHDGSMQSLEAAVKNMAKVQLGRDLTDPQAASIVTFLKSLTGAAPAGSK
ncbi:MAG: PQQ-dependent sugar dehydrogenase [Planctomycetota bacterium]